MAHFARVENGIVKQVIVAEQDFIDNIVGDAPGEWIQTSINTHGGVHYQANVYPKTPSDDQTQALRYNFAGTNWHYDRDADAFYSPQPYPSWTLNTSTYLWEAPVARPTDDGIYDWNEETQTWDAVEAE
jgi:hypothetical protein